MGVRKQLPYGLKVPLDIEVPSMKRRVAIGMEIHPPDPNLSEDIEAPPELTLRPEPDLLDGGRDWQVERRVPDHFQPACFESGADRARVHFPGCGARRLERQVDEFH